MCCSCQIDSSHRFLHYRTPLVEELLIVLHSIHLSPNTKQALSTKPQFITPAATALHTPSTIHNQLAQLQEGHAQQTPASPPRQHSRHAYNQAKRDSSSSHTTPSSAAAPTPLSRSALQNAERGAVASSSLKRQLPSHRGPPGSQTDDQQSVASTSQTEYRNPVFGQVSKESGQAFCTVHQCQGLQRLFGSCCCCVCLRVLALVTSLCLAM